MLTKYLNLEWNKTLTGKPEFASLRLFESGRIQIFLFQSISELKAIDFDEFLCEESLRSPTRFENYSKQWYPIPELGIMKKHLRATGRKEFGFSSKQNHFSGHLYRHFIGKIVSSISRRKTHCQCNPILENRLSGLFESHCRTSPCV